MDSSIPRDTPAFRYVPSRFSQVEGGVPEALRATGYGNTDDVADSPSLYPEDDERHVQWLEDDRFPSRSGGGYWWGHAGPSSPRPLSPRVFDPLPLANDFLPFREVEGLLGPGLFPASKLRTASRGHSPTPDSRSHTTSLNIAAKLLDLASPEEVLQQSFLVAAGEAAAKGIRWSEATERLLFRALEHNTTSLVMVFQKKINAMRGIVGALVKQQEHDQHSIRHLRKLHQDAGSEAARLRTELNSLRYRLEKADQHSGSLRREIEILQKREAARRRDSYSFALPADIANGQESLAKSSDDDVDYKHSKMSYLELGVPPGAEAPSSYPGAGPFNTYSAPFPGAARSRGAASGLTERFSGRRAPKPEQDAGKGAATSDSETLPKRAHSPTLKPKQGRNPLPPQVTAAEEAPSDEGGNRITTIDLSAAARGGKRSQQHEGKATASKTATKSPLRKLKSDVKVEQEQPTLSLIPGISQGSGPSDSLQPSPSITAHPSFSGSVNEFPAEAGRVRRGSVGGIPIELHNDESSSPEAAGSPNSAASGEIATSNSHEKTISAIRESQAYERQERVWKPSPTTPHRTLSSSQPNEEQSPGSAPSTALTAARGRSPSSGGGRAAVGKEKGKELSSWMKTEAVPQPAPDALQIPIQLSRGSAESVASASQEGGEEPGEESEEEEGAFFLAGDQPEEPTAAVPQTPPKGSATKLSESAEPQVLFPSPRRQRIRTTGQATKADADDSATAAARSSPSLPTESSKPHGHADASAEKQGSSTSKTSSTNIKKDRSPSLDREPSHSPRKARQANDKSQATSPRKPPRVTPSPQAPESTEEREASSRSSRTGKPREAPQSTKKGRDNEGVVNTGAKATSGNDGSGSDDLVPRSENGQYSTPPRQARGAQSDASPLRRAATHTAMSPRRPPGGRDTPSRASSFRRRGTPKSKSSPRERQHSTSPRPRPPKHEGSRTRTRSSRHDSTDRRRSEASTTKESSTLSSDSEGMPENGRERRDTSFSVATGEIDSVVDHSDTDELAHAEEGRISVASTQRSAETLGSRKQSTTSASTSVAAPEGDDSSRGDKEEAVSATAPEGQANAQRDEAGEGEAKKEVKKPRLTVITDNAPTNLPEGEAKPDAPPEASLDIPPNTPSQAVISSLKAENEALLTPFDASEEKMLALFDDIDQLKSELERAARAGANVSQTFLLRFSTLKGRFVRLRNEKVSLEEEIQGKEAKTKEEMEALKQVLENRTAELQRMKTQLAIEQQKTEAALKSPKKAKGKHKTSQKHGHKKHHRVDSKATTAFSPPRKSSIVSPSKTSSTSTPGGGHGSGSSSSHPTSAAPAPPREAVYAASSKDKSAAAMSFRSLREVPEPDATADSDAGVVHTLEGSTSATESRSSLVKGSSFLETKRRVETVDRAASPLPAEILESSVLKTLRDQLKSKNQAALEREEQILALKREVAGLMSGQLAGGSDVPKKVHARQQVYRMMREVNNCIALCTKIEKVLRNDVTCLVCLNVVEQPMTIIPCGHTFCYKCIQDLKNWVHRYQCPVCRARELSGLPTDDTPGAADLKAKPKLNFNASAQMAPDRPKQFSVDDIAKVVLGNFKNRRGSTGSVGGMEDNQVDDETTFLAQSAGLSAPDRVLLEKEREHTVAMNKLKLVIKSRDFKALVTGNRAKDADHALDSMHLPELRRGSQHGVSLEDEAPGLNQPGTGPRQWGGDLTGAAVFNPSIDTIAARFQWWQVPFQAVRNAQKKLARLVDELTASDNPVEGK